MVINNYVGNYANRLAALGAAIPQILLPEAGTDLSKWAVIACDQHTQDREYWEAVRTSVGNNPSSLNFILPEVYLEDPGMEERIAGIHRTMNHYLETNVFAPPLKTLVYVERDTPFHQSRKGLVIALDLECYDWKTSDSCQHKNNSLLIRPTEGTVPERLPPRMEIRKNAPLETSHILVLIEDEENALLPALGERAKHREPSVSDQNNLLYGTKLLPESGRIQGWKLDKEDDWNFLAEGLEKLAKKSLGKYGTGTPFLYAVGDGNHSLAAAKSVWEEYKKAHQDEPALMDHPARFALVELVNLHDPALNFEPIHRLLFGADVTLVQQALGKLPGYSCQKLKNFAELAAMTGDEQCGLLRLGLISCDCYLLIEADPVPLALDLLQPILDKLINYQSDGQKRNISIDYIHGGDELLRIVKDKSPGMEKAPDVTGILLPPFRKNKLFETVAKRGTLPRKSFSMGEASEKRYYLECRKLF
jgi:hypothetical protein